MGKTALVLRAMDVLAENADVDSLDESVLQAAVIGDGKRAGREFRQFLENRAKMELVLPGKHIVDCRRASMPAEWQKAGWKVEHHRNLGIQIYDPESVRLYLAEAQKTGVVRGDKLRKLLAEEPTLPDAFLDFFLANPELIPEACKGKAVFFWGTIYRNPDGDLCVRFLYQLGEGWGLGYDWLDDGWDGFDPALVLASFE